MKEMEELSGVQKTAILLIALGPERSAKIFKHLKEEEIEQLTLEIANTRSVSQTTKEGVMDEVFQVCLAQQYIAAGGHWYSEELVGKGLGPGTGEQEGEGHGQEETEDPGGENCGDG